jgi:Na+/H+ antiporter NhaD/arsenite permease-like protein
MKPDAVAGGFPAPLFVTLAGVTLLFGLAHVNGTLEWLAQRAVRLARGNAQVIPILFFLIALVLSAVGPGAVLGVALLIPLAMPIGVEAGVPRLLTALMVANGANAGNLSPVSVVGLIANTKMAEAGIGGHEWAVFAANVVAHLVVGIAAYVLFGGRNLPHQSVRPSAPMPALTSAQAITTAVVLAWIAAVIIFKLNVGMAAFAAASILVLLKAADEVAAIKQIPWGVIIMVCGVTMLIAVLEKTGGMDLFSAMIATIAMPSTINGTIAFVTGLISSWSSTSGVVLPAFLPTVPSLVANVGGGDPVAVAISINIGSALVDVSPLSTLGALCVATVNDPLEARVLFRQLLIWGLSMTMVGAVIAQLMAGFFARS